MPTAQLDWHDLRVAVAVLGVAAAVVGWLVAVFGGRRMVRSIGIQGLSTIGVLSGLHVAVSYASRISGFLLSGLFGPYAVFIIGLTSEGLTSLLFAVVVVLVPRPGAFAISSLTVFTANALFTGQLGLVDVLFVSISMATAEGCLVLLGVTSLKVQPSALWSYAVRIALAIGIANMATLYAQYCLAQVAYRLNFADWYVATLALVTGLLYGSVGAALGVLVGWRLRRVAL